MAALTDLIDFQRDSARQLLAVLERETLAITSRVARDIEMIAKEKVTLIEALKTTDQRIAAHPHLASAQQEVDFNQKVSEIRLLIEQCQTINQANGDALHRAQLSFRKLNNLFQQTHGKVGMTYNAAGKTHTISTLGTNIKA
ncbi:flagellar protein FlgN [Vibrio sp. SM6]|uniref:Flagellar protein FlgN n=1 Tax=Vibrio agarilyticus TaxID=2726741 RepID=A0A7X8YFG5_9VIBR|nr:flagellar export chaperone FlgN [Vibrio agarilyticus]NLS11634.1 flagellar protein FlgN [Vibrio agarilyticus]